MTASFPGLNAHGRLAFATDAAGREWLLVGPYRLALRIVDFVVGRVGTVELGGRSAWASVETVS